MRKRKNVRVTSKGKAVRLDRLFLFAVLCVCLKYFYERHSLTL